MTAREITVRQGRFVLKTRTWPAASAPAQFLRWCENFVAVPQVEISSSRPVCPCMPGLLRDRSIAFFNYLGSADAEALEHRVAEIGRLAYAQGNEDDETPTAIVIVWPKPETIPGLGAMLRASTSAVKEYCIAQGFICGEFFPENTDHSARSEDLAIANAPIPAVVVRRLSPHDRLFFQDNPARMAQFMEFFNNVSDRVIKRNA